MWRPARLHRACTVIRHALTRRTAHRAIQPVATTPASYLPASSRSFHAGACTASLETSTTTTTAAAASFTFATTLSPAPTTTTTELYSSLLNELLTINTARKIRLGIETTRSLLDALGAKYDLTKTDIPTIHVAGSNGKGSVATKLAMALQLHGLRVGLYTSPHISSYRERMQVNEDLITEEEVCEMLPQILETTRRTDIPATFFEIGTALAFGFFIRRNVDIAVIEVGLGGRLDSTNVITPELSIITSISLEHTAWLGDTIEKITREKAGILKRDIPALIGPHVEEKIVRSVADEVHAGEIYKCAQTFDDYDDENSATALTALAILSTRPRIAALLGSHGFDDDLCERAMATRPPCRFQRVRRVDPKTKQTHQVVLDVCHNPDAFVRLFQKMTREFGGGQSNNSAAQRARPPIIAIAGFSSDKDVGACMEQLMQHCKMVFIVSADTPRAATIDQVLTTVKEKDLRAKYPGCIVGSTSPSAYTTLTQLLASLPGSAQQQQAPIILCCGTFFIMADVRRALGMPHPIDDIQINEQSMKKG